MSESFALEVGVSAAINLAAAVIVASTGSGVMLYERFSVRSRKLALVTGILGLVLMCYGIRESVGPEGRDLWFRAAIALDALLAPAVYALTVDVVQARRRLLVRLLLAAGVMLSIGSLVSPDVISGIASVQQYRFGAAGAWKGLLFLGFMVLTLSGTAVELVWSARKAIHRDDRRRAITLIVGCVIGATAMIDLFLRELPFGGAGVTPFMLTIMVLIFAVAALRYRAFSLLPSFASERVLEVMTDGALLCDAAGRIRTANPAACALLGEPERMIAGLHVSSIFRDGTSAGDGALPAASEVSFRAGVKIGDVALTLVRRDGRAIPVSLSSEPLRQRGETVGSVLVFRDITERIRSARLLHSTEQKYQSLFWNNPSLVYEFDTHGTVLHVNNALERALGVGSSEAAGQPFTRFVHPDDLTHALSVMNGVLAGSREAYRLRLLGPNGVVAIKGVSSPVVRDGQVVGIFGVALDITQEERVSGELELQRLELAQLFEASPEAMLVADENDVITRINPEFTRTFGYTADEAIGHRVDDLLVPDDLAPEGEGLTAGARRGEIVRAETVRRRRDGTLVDVSVLAREVRVPGHAPQLYGIYRDITEHRRAERSLRDRDEQLRHAQRLESIGKLAGGVAHDFNNLVTVINGHVRFALEVLPETSPARHDLEQVELAGSRAANLTQQLLAFSRRQLLRPETVDAASIIADVRRMLGRIIGEHIHFDTSHHGAALVRADRGQLEQLLVNLVVNARDAMPDGGRLTITTDRAVLPDPETAATGWEPDAGEYVRISVTDTGTGMDEATCARAFDPFFTTKEQGKGTGLGLATVFGIAKQSGGHVTAASAPGRGTTIRVWLPAATITAATTTTPAPIAADDCASLPDVTATRSKTCTQNEERAARVLVVEDEVALRELAARILRRAGHDVLLAADGVEALDITRHTRPDLVLSDLVMPRMGGRELSRRLRLSCPDVPIILMSGYDDEIASGTAHEAILSKPFTPAELANRVRLVLAASVTT